jgi:hypothetical protein
MRVAREKLIFLALSLLVRWSDRSAKGPLQPDIGVRLALAFLYTCGESQDRCTYDEFWRRLSDPGLAGKHVGENDYIRRSYADSCIKGIIRDVGAPETPEYWAGLLCAGRTKEEKSLPHK